MFERLGGAGRNHPPECNRPRGDFGLPTICSPFLGTPWIPSGASPPLHSSYVFWETSSVPKLQRCHVTRLGHPPSPLPQLL